MIEDKLRQLKELDAHLDVIRMDKKSAIDSVITSEIKAELDAIDAEFDGISEAIIATIDQLTAEVKDEVLVSGSSIKKGKTHYGASFIKGRVSWDIKALEGYAVAHPEIEKFRKKDGDPSVRINKKG